MKTFTVHHPTGELREMTDAPEKLVFVKEGFCWPAIFFPLIWMLFRRMWIISAVYFAAVLVISTVIALLGVPSWVNLVISGGVHLFVALDGNELRRWSLERRGYKMIDIVTANTKQECELLFFARLAESHAGAAAQSQSVQKLNQRAGITRLARQPGEDGMFPVTGGDA